MSFTILRIYDCDICKEKIANKGWGEFVLPDKKAVYGVSKIDICEKCAKKIHKFIKNEKSKFADPRYRR